MSVVVNGWDMVSGVGYCLLYCRIDSLVIRELVYISVLCVNLRYDIYYSVYI